jgi:hypothetical protein
MKTLAITFIDPLRTTHDGRVSASGAVFSFSIIEVRDEETNTLYLVHPDKFSASNEGIDMDFGNLHIFVRRDKVKEVKIEF